MDYRIGQGYDVHRLAEGETLWLGGILIPFSRGTVAHSDGDVLLHAICDSLLGAAGLGDICKHFTDSDPAYKDIDSSKLVNEVIKELANKSYYVSHIDCTVVLERPKLAGHISNMRINVSKLLKISKENVNIKATTNEGMGFIGRGEGVAAFAVALIMENNSF